MKDKPNILWIQTDEQRPDSLGCYGSQWARTPNLDGLARRGTVFHECHVQSPLCVPSRTSMLTCRYPTETNVLTHDSGLRDGLLSADDKTFVNLFADAGYHTRSIGKWHTPNHPTWQVQEEFALFTESGAPTVANPVSLVPPYSDQEHRVIKRKGLSAIIMSGLYPYHDWGATPSSHLTDRAIEWLQQEAAREEPFLLRVSHLWPHTPVLVPRPWDQLYAPDDIPFRPFNRKAYENRSTFDREHSDLEDCADLPEATWRRCRADYFALCAYLDHQVGRRLRALDQIGLADDTIVAYNSDHGRSLGELGLSEKCNFDREVWRVPFILSGPGLIPEGEQRHDLAELMDFGPTLCGLTGIDLTPGMRGRNLFDSTEPEAVFGVVDPVHIDGLPQQRRAALRTRRFRYDCTVERDGQQVAIDECDANLIDLESDPLEEVNLAYDPRHAHTARDLHCKIEEYAAL